MYILKQSSTEVLTKYLWKPEPIPLNIKTLSIIKKNRKERRKKLCKNVTILEIARKGKKNIYIFIFFHNY